MRRRLPRAFSKAVEAGLASTEAGYISPSRRLLAGPPWGGMEATAPAATDDQARFIGGGVVNSDRIEDLFSSCLSGLDTRP